MLIMHIIVGLDTGGAERMLQRLVAYENQKPSYQHVIVSLTELGNIGEKLQSTGVSVHTLNMIAGFELPFVLFRLMKMIRSLTPDIVQTWMYHADFLGGLASLMVGNRRVIWGVRTTDVKAGGSRVTAFIRKMCALLSHRVPHTIVCAAEASRRVHEALGYDARRMVVIPNGFEMEGLVATKSQRSRLRTECSFSKEHIVIGSLGRFNAVKDQKNFVQAAAILARRFPNVRFLMVGRELNNTNQELSQWIEETGYADRFVLLGERDDVPVCLAAMDIFCLHSRTEGFPNALGEAMAMELPCVTTDVGDAAMLLADNGIVVEKENSVALAQGLERLLEMPPHERHELGQQARERIQSEFSMERVCDQFENIYRRVMDNR